MLAGTGAGAGTGSSTPPVEAVLTGGGGEAAAAAVVVAAAETAGGSGGSGGNMVEEALLGLVHKITDVGKAGGGADGKVEGPVVKVDAEGKLVQVRGRLVG